MIKFLLFLVLLPITLIGCTRSTDSGDVSAPPTAVLGTSMLTLEPSKSAITDPTNAGKTKTFSVVTSTKTPLGPNSTPGITITRSITISSSMTHAITKTPPPTPTTKLPSGVPVEKWRDIPIMPDAVTGDEEADRYRFMVKAEVDQVEEFYKKELVKLGWKFDARGTGENGAPIFIFSKSGKIISISVIVIGDILVVSLAPI
jgi:hypothetical protein